MNKLIHWLVHEAKTGRHEVLSKPMLWSQEVHREKLGRCQGIDGELPLGEQVKVPI